MASKSEELNDLEMDSNKEPDDELSTVSVTTPLNPPATSPYPIQDQPYPQNQPYPIQNQPYSYYPGPPPANPAYPPGPYMPPPSHYGMQSTQSNTTVIIQQPSQPQIVAPRNWSSKLCECGKDWSICCCAFFCTSCLESQIVRDMGESCLLPCCVPGWLITLRTKMRLQENISGSVIDDCCKVCCCYMCALCQLAYEIKVVRQRTMAPAAATRPI